MPPYTSPPIPDLFLSPDQNFQLEYSPRRRPSSRTLFLTLHCRAKWKERLRVPVQSEFPRQRWGLRNAVLLDNEGFEGELTAQQGQKESQLSLWHCFEVQLSLQVSSALATSLPSPASGLHLNHFPLAPICGFLRGEEWLPLAQDCFSRLYMSPFSMPLTRLN